MCETLNKFKEKKQKGTMLNDRKRKKKRKWISDQSIIKHNWKSYKTIIRYINERAQIQIVSFLETIKYEKGK